MEPTGHCACLSAGRRGSAAAGRTTARSKASVARALMATGQVIDVDRRSLPLVLGRWFLAVASWPLLLPPNATRHPWGINSAGPGQVESRLAREGIVHEGIVHEGMGADRASGADPKYAGLRPKELRNSGGAR